MLDKETITRIVSEVLAGHPPQTAASAPVSASASANGKVGVKDYPLSEVRPELIKTPTGKTLEEITLEAVVSGKVKPEEVRIAPETLELQAQVAEDAGRKAFARNLRRAAEMIAVPDERLLEMYDALRPYRKTKAELLAISDELQNKFGATSCSALVRETAEVYEARDRLKIED